MQIDYKNRKVEKQCCSLKDAKKQFPEKIAKKLFKLINFIVAAENLGSIISSPVYHFHKLNGNLEGLYAMDIDGRSKAYRLIVTFDDYTTEQVFSESISIVQIKVEEVSKHYE
ncbi:type II toxin-antitoxin system RelE/ParE family toxin [Companilactobacillus zhachilii]|uniref:type II toxin-antitoxin system RelE/ParE family toxin n=1 Tax=Companilactobacillus zhachilii TaxID=2304606 RepID=UPI004034EF20